MPIPGHPDAPPIGYAYLEQLEKMKMETIPHPPQTEKVMMLNVQELLNGVSTTAMRRAGLPSPQKSAICSASFDESEFYNLLFELNVATSLIAGPIDDQLREFVLVHGTAKPNG